MDYPNHSLPQQSHSMNVKESFAIKGYGRRIRFQALSATHMMPSTLAETHDSSSVHHNISH
jgi:hypothetical protein